LTLAAGGAGALPATTGEATAAPVEPGAVAFAAADADGRLAGLAGAPDAEAEAEAVGGGGCGAAAGVAEGALAIDAVVATAGAGATGATAPAADRAFWM
jgi:hypothetical protein